MASALKQAPVLAESTEELTKPKAEISLRLSPTKIHRCPEAGCKKILTSSPGLRYHIKTHFCGNERPYLCEKCQKTFKSANGLKYHVEKTRCENSLLFCGSKEEAPASDEEEKQTCLGAECPDLAKRLFVSVNENEICRKLSLGSLDDHFTSKTATPDRITADHSAQLHGKGGREEGGFLTELAEIATSPHSPLLQPLLASVEKSRIQEELSLIHSYARPPRSRSVSPQHLRTSGTWFRRQLSDGTSSHSQCTSEEDVKDECSEESAGEERVTSSSPYPSSSRKSDTNGCWSHTWPTAVWQCFMKECQIKFSSGPVAHLWQKPETLGRAEHLSRVTHPDSHKRPVYAAKGLRLTNKRADPDDSSGYEMILLGFSPDCQGQPDLIAQCPLHHPFFVREKGWSSFSPALTVERFGIPCREMAVGDVCLPPTHPQATYTADIFDTLRSYDLTPEDSTAVFMLSSMAKQKRDQLESSPVKRKTDLAMKPRSRQRHVSEPTISRAKRPMNAFMLFAKKYRMEYTQAHPGRDNRAISVLLGDMWKRLKTDERRAFTQEARILADEHRKHNPNCWKRNRSSSLVRARSNKFWKPVTSFLFLW